MYSTVEGWYRHVSDLPLLSPVNIFLVRELMQVIGLSTPLHESANLPSANTATQRLLTICRELGATRYLSGPAAKDYMNVNTFDQAGIKVEWMDYADYPTYRQADGQYEPAVSLLDALMWLKPEAVMGEVN